jgi:hypothetical protein
MASRRIQNERRRFRSKASCLVYGGGCLLASSLFMLGSLSLQLLRQDWNYFVGTSNDYKRMLRETPPSVVAVTGSLVLIAGQY